MPPVIKRCLLSLAILGFSEHFEGPNLTGFRLRMLEGAGVVALATAEESAGAVAVAFYVEAVEPNHGSLRSEGSG